MSDYEKIQKEKLRDELIEKVELIQQRPYRRWSSNFGMIASLGGVIIMPIIIGLFGGGYLDEYFPQRFSWRLSGIFLGFAWGLFNAYFWVKAEDRKIEKLTQQDGESKK